MPPKNTFNNEVNKIFYEMQNNEEFLKLIKSILVLYLHKSANMNVQCLSDTLNIQYKELTMDMNIDITNITKKTINFLVNDNYTYNIINLYFKEKYIIDHIKSSKDEDLINYVYSHIRTQQFCP